MHNETLFYICGIGLAVSAVVFRSAVSSAGSGAFTGRAARPRLVRARTTALSHLE